MSIVDRSDSRQGAAVVWLAVHTTEGDGTAQTLRDAAWWAGSSHAINDESGTLLTPADGCVPYDRASWTLRAGNPVSENIEQVGWAHWTRAEWLARPALLEGTARWLADRSAARGIPLVRLTSEQVRARRPGVLGHGDYTAATGDGTHTDPGPNYPWDVVLDRAQQIANGDNDMQLNEPIPNANPFADRSKPTTVQNLLLDVQANAAYAARQTAGVGAALEAMTKLVSQQNGLTLEDVRRAVAEEIAAGLSVDVTVSSPSADKPA